MKTISKGLKEIVLIPVDLESKYYKISRTNYVCSKRSLSDQWFVETDKPLDGKFEIVCSVANITENIAKELVQYENGQYVYRNYNANSLDDAWDCQTAVQSFYSLLKSEGLYGSNYLILIKEKREFSKLKMLQQSEVAYLDGKIIKDRYGKAEVDFDVTTLNQYDVDLFSSEDRILHLKSK